MASRSLNAFKVRMSVARGTNIERFRRRLTTSTIRDQFCSDGLAASIAP